MLGTPITNGFSYRQAAIPTGAVIGQTWQQLNSSGIPVLNYAYDGSFWRITGGLNGLPRSIPADAGTVATTGSTATSLRTGGARRLQLASGATGTGSVLFNRRATATSILGKAQAAGASPQADYSRPVETLIRFAAQKTGIFRFYLFGGASLDPTINLNASGYGFRLDLTTGAADIHVHNGSALSTQSVGNLPNWTDAVFFDLELCWDGVSSLALYFCGTFIGRLTGVAPTQSFNNDFFHLIANYDQSTAASVAQFIDIHYLETRGGY